MIYVSSSCVRHERIEDSIKELAQNGIRHIELSGGTKYYERYEDALLALKKDYGLEYLVHNYFPPHETDFVLNLASLDDEIYQKSLEHCEEALRVSRKLGSRKYGIHAGFLIDFPPEEIGRKISAAKLYDEDQAIRRFCEGYNHLKEQAKGVELYIENNVFSLSNARTFKDKNPFLMSDYDGFKKLRRLIDFKLLLDIAHLRVSANCLGLDFSQQLRDLMAVSDYIHLSDNDGQHDENRRFSEGSEILRILKGYTFDHKIVTLEIYGSIADLETSRTMVTEILNINNIMRSEK